MIEFYHLLISPIDMRRKAKKVIKELLYMFVPGKALLRHVKAQNKVYLTFDDGPHGENTPRLLDVLKETGASATFFVVGKEVEKYPYLLQRIKDEGHLIGGHSWSHDKLPLLSFAKTWHEFIRTKKEIRKATEIDTILYRPPFGWITFPMILYAILGRMKLIMWSIDSNDDSTQSSTAIIERGRETNGGDIFLCHDDNSGIIEALPFLVKEWQSRGLKVCALHE
jgi:peptidoglycan-N-acetylglucosamine deacetylase